MILACHAIVSAYGFWLPNDPRGSWSDFVWSWELARFGEATKVGTRRSVAHRPHDRDLRQAAKAALKCPPARFTGLQARAVGHGFAKFIAKSGLVAWACSILPEHLHLVLARHRYGAKQAVQLLKGAATRALLDEDLHPFGHLVDQKGRVPKAFAEREWIVYLDSEEDIRRAIKYVEENPMKEGLRRQSWPFVTPFEGQPFA